MKETKTQTFVPIKEIKNDTIVREDGTLCGVLLVSSINLVLQSEDEQEAVLSQFQSVLNSLEVTTQIIVQSRKLNIAPYLNYIKELSEKQPNELLKLQSIEYMNFIKHFTEQVNIMSKHFFVIITYTPYTTTADISSAFGKNKKTKSAEQTKFEELLFQLDQRMGFVSSGLRSVGLRTARLNSDELIEMLYSTFNPGEIGAPKTI